MCIILPKIFIGSSKEKKEFADNLQVSMKDWANAEVWNEIFDLSETTIETLEKRLPEFDVCIFLLTADDTLKIREDEVKIARDNLIFEMGLSVAYIGRKNTIIVKEQHTRIISDLLGVTYIVHDFSQNINIVSTQIRNHYNKSKKIDYENITKNSLDTLLIDTLNKLNLTDKQLRYYAWICALRALPFLFYENTFKFWKEKSWQKRLFAIFNALDCASMNIHTLSKLDNIAPSDARATYNAAASADKAAFDAYLYTIHAYTAYASAANAVSAAVAAAARATDNAAAYSATRATYDAMAYSSHAAYSINFIGRYHSILLSDIRMIKGNQINKIESHMELYGNIWERAEKNLGSLGCGYWFRLYNDVFKSRFQMNFDELRFRLDIPNEIKNQGASAVALYMEEKWLSSFESSSITYA